MRRRCGRSRWRRRSRWRAQLASAEAQLGQALAQLAAAQERAGNQNVVASVSGIISEKRVSTGDVVAPARPSAAPSPASRRASTPAPRRRGDVDAPHAADHPAIYELMARARERAGRMMKRIAPRAAPPS